MNSWKLLVWVLMLFPSIVLAQTEHVIVPNRTIEVKNGSKDYGSIIYRLILIGGTKTGTDQFDFSGKKEARLKLEIKGVAGAKRFRDRVLVKVLESNLRNLRKDEWIIDNEVIEIPIKLGALNGGFSEYSFKVTEPGEISFPSLLLSWLDKRDDKPIIEESSWTTLPREQSILGRNIIISGLKTAADYEWESLKISGNAPLILDFVSTLEGKAKLEEARPIIERLVEADWTELVIRSHEAIPPKKEFVKKYGKYRGTGFKIINDRLDSAIKNIKEIEDALKDDIENDVEDDDEGDEPPSPVDDAKMAWKNAVEKRDTQLLLNYLIDFSGVIPENDESVPDSLSCWSPPIVRLISTKENGPIQFQLKNFIAPAYYDIYEGRLEIDDLLLLNEKRLSIDVQRSGKFNLTIVDKGCSRKQVDIPLDNLMSAAVTADTLSGSYFFSFEGGKQPYALQLVPESGQGKEYVRQNIRGDKLELSRDSLQAAGLNGKYLASAYSTDSDSPVAVAGPTIDVPERPWPSWILPALIVLAVGLLALLLLFILRNGKPQQRTIFEEA